MKMMLHDVIDHENQSQHFPDHQCLCVVLSGRITTQDGFFIPHRPSFKFVYSQ